MEENKKYIVSGIDNNILTKVGHNCWTGIMGKIPFKINRRHFWKIEILESHKKNNSIIIGIASNSFDVNNPTYSNCGWFICCCCGHLFSGAPHNYSNKKIVDKFKLKSKVITFIMDMEKGSLKYIIGSEKPVCLYSKIPTEKPLFPIIFLKYKDDKVKVSQINSHPLMFKSIYKGKKEKAKQKKKIEDEKEDKIEEEYEQSGFSFRGNRRFGGFRYFGRIRFNRGFRGMRGSRRFGGRGMRFRK